MKRIFAICLLLTIVFIGCKQHDSVSVEGTVVEYHVTGTKNTGDMSIAYNSEFDQSFGGQYPSPWVYKFTTDKKPFTPKVRASAVGIDASVTVKILVNGTVVKSETGTGATGAEAQYMIQ